MNQFVMWGHKDRNEQVEFHGIPFCVFRKDGTVRKIEERDKISIITESILGGPIFKALFFLGMVTEKPEGSEWWGQNERYYYHGARLFIGDRIARIEVIYADNTCETVPVIFGVNIWPYELFSPLKENEKKLNNYSGPYPEPFASDGYTRKLLYDSLILMENDEEKGMKYIFGLKVKEKAIREIVISRETYKEAGIVVSAVTGLKAGAEFNSEWKVYAPDYFVKKEYYPAMDKLARRLYQFRDEIPQSVKPEVPVSYQGPKVWFSGKPAAEIYSNVFMQNLHDIASNKIDESGKSHTSSKNAISFGHYVGFGTYKHTGTYYLQAWSRDSGRIMTETMRAGIHDRMRAAGETHHRYLYDGCTRYKHPHWKRIANLKELGDAELEKMITGKENDGHASLMLFIYNLYANGVVDKQWLMDNKKHLKAAAGWFFWQMENPSESNFDKVLYSESEASRHVYGGYDLFSNTYAYYALRGYSILAQEIGDTELSEKCSGYALLLRIGIMERFTAVHPRYGRIFTDTLDDCWTWEYKRFAPLFIMADIFTYDPSLYDEEWYRIAVNTYKAQKEDYFSYAAGRQMGYGQGYLTETAILLDEYEDMAGCMEMAAYFCYHHTDFNWIVPEGVIMHPSGRFWFRNCDLGNAVQQGEIVKCGRLLIGLDNNLRDEGMNLVPRLPDGWDIMEVQDYKVYCMTRTDNKLVSVNLNYKRTGSGWELNFNADDDIKIGNVRLGPFSAGKNSIRVKGAEKFLIKEISGKTFVYVEIGNFINRIALSAEL